MDVPEPQRSALGVRHALWIYARPSALFNRVEDTGAYGWSLVILLGLVAMAGYLQAKTGLIDRVVEEQTAKNLDKLEPKAGEPVDHAKLREALEKAQKQGEFTKTITRLWVIVGSPVVMLLSFMLIASVLYAAVALTGRKPEWHTLMSICVYAGFIELIAVLLRVAMMVFYRTVDVNTSLAMLATPGKPSLLAAVDPFLLWYWVLVAMGLTLTRQLSRRMAIVSCVMMCLVSMGLRVGMSLVSVS